MRGVGHGTLYWCVNRVLWLTFLPYFSQECMSLVLIVEYKFEGFCWPPPCLPLGFIFLFTNFVCYWYCVCDLI